MVFSGFTFGLTDISLYVFFVLFFSAFSFLKKSFSGNGILVGNVVGLLVFFFGGIKSFLALAVFFVLSEAATSLSRRKLGTKHEKRTMSNVLGNSLAGIAALFFGQVPVFFGVISAALSDTLSGEIGMVSKKKPVMITSFTHVEVGTNGGITSLGLIAGALGGLVMAVLYLAFYKEQATAIFVFLAGIVGTIADSFFGATLENKKIIGKSAVNFLATLAGALTIIVLQALTLGT